MSDDIMKFVDKRDRYGKRGELSINLIMLFALVVVSMLIGYAIIVQFRDVAKSSTDDTDCMTSIQAHSTAMKLSKELAAADVPIICPSHDIAVDTKDPEVVKAALANEMKSCWHKWGEGKLQLFSQEGTYCHVCSMVQVNGVDSIQGFPEYLDKTKISSTQTYSEYLSGTKSGAYYATDQLAKSSTSSMPSKNVGVIFVYAKGRTAIDSLLNKIITPANGAKVGLGAGAIIGLGLCYVGGAIITAGTVGVGTPVLLACTAAGAAVGGVAGGVAGYTSHIEASYMSVVVVRPLTADQLNSLGCQYNPAKNK